MKKIPKLKKPAGLRFRPANAAKVWRGDAERVFSSVVGIIIIFGLSVVPCLYAWFNIFSNWDPYGPEATSRIRVAVSSDDSGVSLFGLTLNVGDMVIDGLEANDTIGWVFTQTQEEALALVDSGNCYAALVIPPEFSHDVVSFIALDFEHPAIHYYENAKKNAVAPKITGKAKTAVQEQVNAAFAETIASAVSNVLSVADANGIDFEGTLKTLSGKTEELNGRLDDVDALLASVSRLIQSSELLMYNSGILSGNIADTSYAAGDYSVLILYYSESLSGKVDDMNEAILEQMKQAEERLREIEERMKETGQAQQAIQDAEAEQAALLEEYFPETGPGEETGYPLPEPETESPLPIMEEEAEETAVPEAVEALAPDEAPIPTEEPAPPEEPTPSELLAKLRTEMETMAAQLDAVMSDMSELAGSASATFDNIGGKTSTLSDTLIRFVPLLEETRDNICRARTTLEQAQEILSQLSQSLKKLSDSEFLLEVTNAVMNNRDELAPYFASPIRMNTFVMYPIENYGSAMAPFYTVLAQWVGALFCAALLKARVRREDRPCELSVPEEFIGRYGLFFFVGMIQALVCALGDLWFVGIYCLHPGLFVLAAAVSGLCFSLINYALLFSLEKIGLGASVIIMVIQVAGSGGSYPVEVVPEIFRKMYPYMPFNYAMNAMREAIAGTYGNHYQRDILILLLISVIFFALGLALYRPAHRLNQMIAESAEKSEIML